MIIELDEANKLDCRVYEVDGFGECILLDDTIKILCSRYLVSKYIKKGMLTRLEIPPKYRRLENFTSREMLIPLNEVRKIYSGGIKIERPSKSNG